MGGLRATILREGERGRGEGRGKGEGDLPEGRMRKSVFEGVDCIEGLKSLYLGNENRELTLFRCNKKSRGKEDSRGG